MLGTVSFLHMLPMTFLTLLAGVLADRVDRRKLLFSTQMVLMTSAFLLGLLTSSGVVAVWHVMTLALVAGIAMAFDIPIRQSVVPTLVGKRHIMNAIALNSSAFNTARIIGPALAGILVSRIGLGRCFYVNSASFLAFIIAISLIEIKSFREPSDQPGMWSDFQLGLRYVWTHGTLRTLVGMAAVPSIFAMPYVTLMPIFAKDILNVGVQGLGMLMSATGVGGLSGALTLALLSRSERKGRILTAGSLLLPVMLVLFANSRSFGLSLAFLVGVGFMTLTFLASVNTLIQSIVPDDLRGRVVSTYMFAFLGLMPLGHLLMGAVANSFGAPLAVTGGGLVCAGFALVVLVRRPEIRRFQ